MLALATLLFTWTLAIPIGIISAVKQYSLTDHVFTFLSYLGIGTPNFLLALVLMWLAFAYFGWNVGGLFSREFMDAPWSWARFVDLMKHLWIPVIVIGTDGMAGLVRVMRANLLDELSKPYVVTARTKGLSEWRIIAKYPVRLAINPFISVVGWSLPRLMSAGLIVSVVLSLPTLDPLLLEALFAQDYLFAGTILMIISVLTVIGTFVSDILLAIVDPRIRIEA
jgi:peptide/nickel transport system permease protein